MASEYQYVDGSVRVRVAIALLLLVGIGLFFYVEQQISRIIVEIDQVTASQPQVALAMGNRLLLWLVVVSGGLALVIGAYLWQLSRQIERQRRFPPLGFPVAFRTELRQQEAALARAVRYRWGAWLLLLHPVVAGLFWWWFTGGVI